MKKKSDEKRKARKAQYYQENKERLSEIIDDWMESHEEHLKTYRANYYKKNKERIKERARNWYAVNKERAKENQRRRIQLIQKKKEKKNEPPFIHL